MSESSIPKQVCKTCKFSRASSQMGMIECRKTIPTVHLVKGPMPNMVGIQAHWPTLDGAEHCWEWCPKLEVVS